MFCCYLFYRYYGVSTTLICALELRSNVFYGGGLAATLSDVIRSRSARLLPPRITDRDCHILSSGPHRAFFMTAITASAQWSGRKVFDERQRVFVRKVFGPSGPLSAALRATRLRSHLKAMRDGEKRIQQRRRRFRFAVLSRGNDGVSP